ncbi:phosphoribosyltransferase [Sphingomonas corticis]|jgi:hypothetical protein|uniref:Phosphoribosyltransferase n=1 Tax=Sphingomonas corticis TaxID=2722791 RepID=A0ABX1CIQ0_9SPHN|nr:phosphoribosyltransferase family protein [Sphingomonas corticis]NJR77244.1 phosphoribosyltransferase [Sphingomonas corticis]
MPILTALPYRDVLAMIRALADAIAADDWTPTHLVGIGRGGLVPAVYLSHALSVPMLSIDFSAQADPLVAESLLRLAGRAGAGERLLFVDDINDSGRTTARLRAMPGVGDARFATLIDNSRSSERVDYAARTIDRATCKDWFVFPWEAMATGSAILADAEEVPERTG